MNEELDLVCAEVCGAFQSSLVLFDQSPEGFALPTVYSTGHQTSAGMGSTTGEMGGCGGGGALALFLSKDPDHDHRSYAPISPLLIP